MIKLTILVLALFFIVNVSTLPRALPTAQPVIRGFHFHTYYFTKSQSDMAREFYNLVGSETTSNGSLAHCSRGTLRNAPIGPHPIAQFTVCCNATSLPTALGWYMKTRTQLELPVLLHPLTVSEAVDHSTRAMWMGPKVPLDFTGVEQQLPHEPVCEPNPLNDN